MRLGLPVVSNRSPTKIELAPAALLIAAVEYVFDVLIEACFARQQKAFIGCNRLADIRERAIDFFLHRQIWRCAKQFLIRFSIAGDRRNDA